MSKLREKFETKLDSIFYENDNFLSDKIEMSVESCEQITDDFAVKFAEWVDINATQKIDGLWYSCILNIKPKKPITSTELLQIFKDKYYDR